MRSKQRSRRGSTLVLVALMLGAFMGVAAIAADIGRFYVVTGELQTAADAAALRGVAELQFATAADPEPWVETAVTAWVSTTNRADNTNLSVAPEQIVLGFWTPGQNGAPGNFDANLGTRRANAVSVELGRSPLGVFSQMIGRTAGLPLTRRGIAWIGNLSLNCTRPWALNYRPLVQAVNGNSDTTQSLDMAKFVEYQSRSDSARTMIMHNSELTTGNPPDDGVWTAYNLPSGPNGGGNSGSTTYQSQIASCNNIAVNSDAGNGNIQPSTGVGNCGAGTVVCWAIEAIDGMNRGQINGPGICAFQTGNATCFDQQSGAAGVTTDITFANVTGNGSGGIDFKYVGETKLLCWFIRSTDVCNAIPDPRVKTGYRPGTLVVVTSGLKSRTLNPTDIVSNSPSNVQRFFLVR